MRKSGIFFWFVHFVVQLVSHVWLIVTPRTAARQASLSITNSWRLLKLMSIESVMPSNHLILCHLLLLPSIFSSIRVFTNESALCITWPSSMWSFSISTSNEYSELIFFRIDLVWPPCSPRDSQDSSKNYTITFYTISYETASSHGTIDSNVTW